MGFVNDYLTKEEREMFRKRAIPIGVWWRGKGAILGYDKSDSELLCTIDRENQIYLFDLGKDHASEDYNEYNFALVWYDLNDDKGIQFTIQRKYVGDYIIGVGCDMEWYNIKLGLSDKLYSKRKIILDIIKEALTVYGVDGYPDLQPNVNINFDF